MRTYEGFDNDQFCGVCGVRLYSSSNQMGDVCLRCAVASNGQSGLELMKKEIEEDTTINGPNHKPKSVAGSSLLNQDLERDYE